MYPINKEGIFRIRLVSNMTTKVNHQNQKNLQSHLGRLTLKSAETKLEILTATMRERSNTWCKNGLWKDYKYFQLTHQNNRYTIQVTKIKDSKPDQTVSKEELPFQ